MVCEDGYCFQWDYKLHQKSGEFFANQQTDENACEVRTAVFSRDGKTLVTSGRHKLCVWNTETGTLEHMELVPMSEQWLTRISRDGRFLAGSESYVEMYRDDTIRIWDLPSRKLKSSWKLPNARTTSLAFSPDNKKLVTGLDRGTAVIWDVSKRQSEETLK
jgi:WD40 repeat protein